VAEAARVAVRVTDPPVLGMDDVEGAKFEMVGGGALAACAPSGRMAPGRVTSNTERLATNDRTLSDCIVRGYQAPVLNLTREGEILVIVAPAASGRSKHPGKPADGASRRPRPPGDGSARC